MKRKNGSTFVSMFQPAGPRRRVNVPFRMPRRMHPFSRRANFGRQNIRVGGFTGMELKFLDSELTNTNITASWTALNPTGTGATDTLSVPAQGNGESERNGRVYTIDSIMIRGKLTVAEIEGNIAPIPQTRARVIVYWDKQTNNAEAAVTDIMDAGATDDIVAFRNLQNSHRFRILYDKSFLFRQTNMVNEGGSNLFSGGQQIIPFQMYHKFKGGLKVQTDGTTANVTSCTDNNIGLGAIAALTAGAVAPLISYTCRMRFRG